MTEALAFEVGHAIEPIAGEAVSGDAFGAYETSRGVLVALVDGLGHGPRAAVAAQTFLRVVAEHRDRSLDDVFREGHKALLRSRGVVAGLASFDRAERNVEVAIVGNISCSHYRGGRATHFVPIAGVLGSAYRRTRAEHASLEERDLFIMHSDGIRTRHGVDPARDYTTPMACAASLLASCGKAHDDQSVVVIAAAAATGRPQPRTESPADPVQASIRTDTDAVTCATIARAFCARAGLPTRAQWEVGIAVAELATNVVKYATHGQLSLRLVDDVVEVVVSDTGRGIRDVAEAVRDGFTEGSRPFAPAPAGPTRAGLGVGLGSVHRMMDTVRIESDPGRGTTVVATKRRVKRPDA